MSCKEIFHTILERNIWPLQPSTCITYGMQDSQNASSSEQSHVESVGQNTKEILEKPTINNTERDKLMDE